MSELAFTLREPHDAWNCVQTEMTLTCLKCGEKLEVASEKCACPQCGAQWPIVNGIPRFFQTPDYYWGEVGRKEARKLLEEARKGSWVAAVRARFFGDRDMTLGLLDLQRASWAPMLGLDERSVALDIGSGYGAITHSLSRSVGELYSVEAIPERIEFTQERLRQEGINNVRLIQASATALPFAENTFDLVVTNGILEWVGEWDQQGDPRSAQLRFLGRLCRLLKDDGVLVIGVENRIGYNFFLGAEDHSGLRFTSLVPRGLANYMLRHSSRPHHRTRLNAKKEYRTYTYTKRGYRNLLGESGFADASFHWADPGYNQPYHLIPLAMPGLAKKHWLAQLDHPSLSPRRGWRRKLKRALAETGLMQSVVPDFVIFASKRYGRKTRLDGWIRERLGSTGNCNSDEQDSRNLDWELYTQPYARKSVVRLLDQDGVDVAYLKAQIADQGMGEAPKVELENLIKVQDSLTASSKLRVGVPVVLGTLRAGNGTYWLETKANGIELSKLVRQPGYFAATSNVRKEFTGIVESIIELTEALQTVAGASTIPHIWREIPEDLNALPETRDAIEKSRYFGALTNGSVAGWIQHGDLSIENIFLSGKAGKIEVIDWADMAGGFPPLYDLFSLFFSTGYLNPADENVKFSSEEERWIASFERIFFGDSEFAQTVRNLLHSACERLNISTGMIPALLIEFVLIRSHYYRQRSPVQHRVHLQLLSLCVERQRRS